MMVKKKVKLSDIASKLGVSVSLVSFVMSGKWKENRVSQELAKKVQKTAEELGYQPNTAARALRTGKSGVIGLVVADISNSFYGKIAREIENEASRHGFQLMFASSDEKLEKFKKIVDTLISRQVDGLIIVPVKGSATYLIRKKEQGIPIVLVDRNFPKTKLPFVVDDGRFGGKQLTKLLIDNGHQKIATVVFKGELSNYNERVEAFIDTLNQENIKIASDDIIEIPERNFQVILEAKLLISIKNGVQGFFFTQNKIGIEALRIFKKNKIKIPEDIVVASYDNPEIFELGTPTITCYQQSIKEISSHSVKIVKEIINKGHSSLEKIILKGRLIERESSNKLNSSL
ncbi:MAG: LacI family DNA-binding transcriptional regulator [Bacteroidota bacterium]